MIEDLKIARESTKIETELEEVEVKVYVENYSSRDIPLVEVVDIVPEHLILKGKPAAAITLPPRGSAVFSYRVRPLLPGSYTFSDLEVHVYGPLGFFKTQRVVSSPTTVTVLPYYSRVGVSLRSLEKLWGLVVRGRATSGMYDIADFREYSPGDDYRKIVWKTLARTGRVFVREDFGEVRARILLMLDVRSWDWNLGEPPNTLASVELRVLRSLIHSLVGSGNQVDLAICCSATTKVVRNAERDVERALAEVFSYITPHCYCASHLGIFAEAPVYMGRSPSEYSAVILVANPVSIAVENPARFMDLVKVYGDRLKLVIPRFDYELYVDRGDLGRFYRAVADLMEKAGGGVEIIEESMYLRIPGGIEKWR
ncbi:MAG: DUF58 domain-containing protein [Sulfolobales archaeon]|nr:DUF58 domain-containing protein [Sulfolobales archaeon]MDW8082689.1 DUF58 domain-containing protein [Sulfolobales archaeon]